MSQIKKVEPLIKYYLQLRDLSQTPFFNKKTIIENNLSFSLPENLSVTEEKLLSSATMSLHPINECRSLPAFFLKLFDVKKKTSTKIFASLLMVLRAVNEIKKNNKPVIFLTPSSWNKASGLRTAVARAGR